MTHSETIRARLIARHQAELRALDIIAATIDRDASHAPGELEAPPQSISVARVDRRRPSRSAPARKAKKLAKAAEVKPTGRAARAGRDGRLQLLKVIERLQEPFSTADVAKAFLRVHPERAQYVKSGSVSPALLVFVSKGWLNRVAKEGRTSTYRRTAAFAAALADVAGGGAEAKYREFRENLQLNNRSDVTTSIAADSEE